VAKDRGTEVNDQLHSLTTLVPGKEPLYLLNRMVGWAVEMA